MIKYLKDLYWNWKIKRSRKRKHKFVEQWINKQFKIAKVKMTYLECFSDSEWFVNNSITQEQEEQLRKWSLKKLKKLYPNHQEHWIEQQYSWLVLQYGLKTINN